MMKKRKYYPVLLILPVLSLFSSCEEVIEIDLNSSSPLVVAEGYMELDSVCRLKLSYTSDYFNKNPSKVIEDANVSISNNIGTSESLIYMGNGVYSGKTLRGSVNTYYTATIEIEDQLFSGSTNLTPPPEIISLKYEEATFGPPKPGIKPHMVLTILLKNYPDTENNYMLQFTQNGISMEGSYQLMTDHYAPQSDVVKFKSMMLRFYPNDTISVSIYSIDDNTFRYYSQLNDGVGGRMAMSSTPYNPASNLGDNILGYFMARSRTDTTLILK